jgi:hypothetical protein
MAPAWFPSKRRIFGADSLQRATIEYSDTNEDLDVSLQALDLRSAHVVVGVTGSADLLLRALGSDPAFVAGYDANPAQNALAELKRSAMARLSHAEYLLLFGYRDGSGRQGLLEAACESLEEDVRRFWQRDDMVRLVQEGLWRGGSATRKDLDRWEAELRHLEASLRPREFSVAIGLEGTREEREALRAKVARTNPKFAEPAFRNNNHFKFDPFRYPDGMATHPTVAKYAAPFLPPELIRSPLSEEDFQRIRPHLHRASFQTLSIHEALEEMPSQAFDRLYLSNITDYLSTAQERALVESLLDKAKPDALVVLLFLALTPSQQRDLLDHTNWSERGFARLIGLSAWKQQLQQAPVESWAKNLTRSVERLSKGGAKDAAKRASRRLASLDRQHLMKKAEERARHFAQQARDYDYVSAGRNTARTTAQTARAAFQQARDRWLEVQQLSDHDFVLIENEARTLAFHSDIYANLRAAHASKSFYGFHYAILHKVQRRGPTYEIPKDTLTRQARSRD